MNTEEKILILDCGLMPISTWHGYRQIFLSIILNNKQLKILLHNNIAFSEDNTIWPKFDIFLSKLFEHSWWIFSSAEELLHLESYFDLFSNKHIHQYCLISGWTWTSMFTNLFLDFQKVVPKRSIGSFAFYLFYIFE